LAGAALFGLCGCAAVNLPGIPGTNPAPPPPTAPTGAAIPNEPIDLGSYALMDPDAVIRRFRGEIGRRYGPGLTLASVGADLKKNKFSCAASAVAGSGDPPDQVCRRSIKVEGCAHTFQVHLFDDKGQGQLARVRSLYDRTCAEDGLLGGPG
jgi:hypothetical protein